MRWRERYTRRAGSGFCSGGLSEGDMTSILRHSGGPFTSPAGSVAPDLQRRGRIVIDGGKLGVPGPPLDGALPPQLIERGPPQGLGRERAALEGIVGARGIGSQIAQG